MKTTLIFILLVFIACNITAYGQSKIVIRTTYEDGRVTNKKNKLKNEIDTSYNYIDLKNHNIKELSNSHIEKMSCQLITYTEMSIKYQDTITAKYNKYIEALKFINDTLKISFDDLYKTASSNRHNGFLTTSFNTHPPDIKAIYYNDNIEKWSYSLNTYVGDSFDKNRLKTWYYLYCSSFYKKVMNTQVNKQFSDIVFYKLILDYLYIKNKSN